MRLVEENTNRGVLLSANTCKDGNGGWKRNTRYGVRILDITENSSGINQIVFNVIMSKEIPLDKKVYDKVTGLFKVEDNTMIEFTKNDDLLFMKVNGQLRASLKYIGNNTFEGGIGYPKVTFELQNDGSVKVIAVMAANKIYTGIKFLKYNQ